VTLPVVAVDLPAVGERWEVVFTPTMSAPRLRAHKTDSGGRLQLGAAETDQSGMRRALVDWLRERMHELARAQLPSLAAQMGSRYNKVRVGCQSSRWGSMSRHGTISLNCCSLFQRPEVAHYLLVHELAHYHHMNHSARFWKCVSTHEPQWRQLDRELSVGWQHVPQWIFSSRGADA
jgi:predicted metal-dependent hydrolase